MNTTHIYEAPLAIHCVWNAKDDSIVVPIVERLISLLTRDDLSSFARNLTIPIFKYRSEAVNTTPSPLRKINSKKSLCFFFSGLYTATQECWRKYKNEILKNSKVKIIGVALSADALCLFGKDNAIRYYDGELDTRFERCMISIMHEVLRWGLIEVDKSKVAKDCSLKLFLSHTKWDNSLGVKWAIALRNCIFKTNMLSFFDAIDIGPGYEFDKEIENHIENDNCALVAIHTDEYPTRYWCQKEVLIAKENNTPIIVLDLVNSRVDRSFPALANTPVFRYTDTSEKNLLSILLSAIYEAVRSKYVQQLLQGYQIQGWIPNDAIPLRRPPESFMPLCFERKSGIELCYPDPPVYSEEIRWLKDYGIKAFTPLQYDQDGKAGKNLVDKKIGISISDVYPEKYDKSCHPALLKVFSQDIARHILIRGGSLIYGGDLREDGFTRFLVNAAASIDNREPIQKATIDNYLAWPIYVDCEEEMLLKAHYSSFIIFNEIPPPEDIIDKIDVKYKLPPSTPDNCYIWSRCLTTMRQISIEKSFARICAGGKLSGYKGKMPGVLEEIVATLFQYRKPLYLCGGFGGVVGEVCETILTGNISSALTEKWQEEQNGEYKSLQELANSKGHGADYNRITSELCSKECFDALANRSGLSKEDYRQLMKTPFVDECIHLILKGLNNLISSH